MENKNTFPFKSKIKINAEPIDIIPGVGDEIIICGGKELAIDAVVKLHENMVTTEVYCTEDDASGAVLCNPFVFSGEKFGFIGITIMTENPETSAENHSSRFFYAYKMN